MKYFKFIACSDTYAGFDSSGLASAESEDKIDFSEVEEFMYDYVSGWADEDEETEISIFVSEISKEKFEEETKLYSGVFKEKDCTIYFDM